MAGFWWLKMVRKTANVRMGQAAMGALLVLALVASAWSGLAAVDDPGTPDGPNQSDAASTDAAQVRSGAASLDAEARAALAKTAGAVRFTPNHGQEAPEIRFTAMAGPLSIALLDDRIVAVGPAGETASLVLPGSATLVGVEPATSRAHYYYGNNPATWQRDLMQFGAVRYEGVQPGMDVLVYGAPGGIEFDHELAPGTPTSIAGFRVEGAPVVLEEGGLRIDLGGAAFRLSAPVTFQEGPAGREPVASAFRLNGDQVSYEVGPHDPLRPLIIDPALSYSTFMGTSSSETGRSVAVRAVPGAPDQREVFVAGIHSGWGTPSYPAGFASTSRRPLPGSQVHLHAGSATHGRRLGAPLGRDWDRPRLRHRGRRRRRRVHQRRVHIYQFPGSQPHRDHHR
jgi:hypothetical protein